MVNFRKTKGLVTGLLAATLAVSAIGVAHAAVNTFSVDGTSTITVSTQTTLYNATAGCSDTKTRWSSSNPDGLNVVSSSGDQFIVTTDTPGSYAFDITGRFNNDVCISHWTIIAAAPGAPGAPTTAEAKKYTVSVTGYSYKKKGMSTLDNKRAAAVASYLQSLGLDATNSDYVVTGMELTKNTKKARSAKISVTYMKDGKSVTVKKTIYFTAKKSTLSKKSKATLKKLSTSVM